MWARRPRNLCSITRRVKKLFCSSSVQADSGAHPVLPLDMNHDLSSHLSALIFMVKSGMHTDNFYITVLLVNLRFETL